MKKNSPLGGSSIPDFASRWNMPVSTVWHAIKIGRIKVVKFGPRATRIPYEEEQRLVEEGFEKKGTVG